LKATSLADAIRQLSHHESADMNIPNAICSKHFASVKKFLSPKQKMTTLLVLPPKKKTTKQTKKTQLTKKKKSSALP